MLSKKYFKILLFLISIFFILFYSIKNLGFFLDFTNPPIKADALICLGGGKGERINKTIEIYKKLNNTTIYIFITEVDSITLNNNLLLLENVGINKKFIIINKSVKNTYEELTKSNQLIKNLNINSVNIISDEPHSRRIRMILDNFIILKNENIIYNIVGSGVNWWDKKYYYKNKRMAIYFAVRESFKIIHNFLYYSYIKYFDISTETENKLEYYKKIFIFNINKTITFFISY